MTLEEAQKTVDEWIKTYGVRYFSELTNMAVLTEEVGELARIMARTYGDQSFKAGEKQTWAMKWPTCSGVALSGQPDGCGRRKRSERTWRRKPTETRKDIKTTLNYKEYES